MTDANGASAEASAVEKKIIKQVEYYFGDINLARDKFLLEEIKKDDGWISMETMLKFKRLATLSEDAKVITEAIKKSTSALMEVSEDGSKIRRDPAKPLPENNKERRDDLKLRTLYAKGFPIKAELDELIEYLEKAGKTEHVKMRRDKLNGFKGSCFIVYSTQEAAKKFLEGDEFKKYSEDSEDDLKKLYQSDYFKQKEDEKRQGREDRLKEKEERKKKKEEEAEEKFKETITPGAILSIKNVPKDTSREELKQLFDDHSKVAYADFDIGDTEGKLRFQEAESAQKALDAVKAANDGKVTLKDTELECYVLEGEEEITHWKGVFADMKERRDKKKFDRNRKRNSQGRGPPRGGPPHKRRKNDD